MKKAILFFLLFFYFSYGSVFDKFEGKLEKIKGIEAFFTQKTYMKDLDEPETYKGKIFISRDKLKIIYNEPIKQIYFLEGNNLIAYTPEEGQAVKSKLTEEFFTFRVFKAFVSKKGLKSLFALKKENKIGNLTEIFLIPKNSKKVKEVKLVIDENLKIRKIYIWDNEENRLEIEFYDFKYRKKPLNLYIKLPKDTEVISY